MKQHNDEEGRKKKTIALKSMTNDEHDEKSSKEDKGDEDMTLVIRKFRRCIGRKKQGFKKRTLAKGEPSKKKEREGTFVKSARNRSTSKPTILP